MARTARWRTKNDERMSLAAHLVELRNRAGIIALAVLVGSVAGFLLTDFVIAALRAPVDAVAADSDKAAALNFTVVTQAFDLRIQIAVTFGIVASSPVWLYQIWAFLVPGLVRREKQYAIGFLGAAIPLFLAGCAAGWVVMPHVVVLMLGFVNPSDTSFLDARSYYDFVLKLLLVTGIAFVLPVFLVLLNFIGVLSARSILKGWRWAILAITLFTAIATPAADVLSMVLLAIPMIALYFSAAGLAALNDRRRARREKATLEMPTESTSIESAP